jgi:hypothetical protein
MVMWNNPCRGIHQCGRADLSVSHPKSRHDYTFPPAHRVAWLSPHSLPLGRGWWIKLAAIHYPNALPKNRHIVPLFKQGHRCGSKEEWRCTHRIGIVRGSFPQYAYTLGFLPATPMGSRCSHRAVRGSYSRAPMWYSPVKAIYTCRTRRSTETAALSAGRAY